MQRLLYPELPGTFGLRCRELRVQVRQMFGDTCRFLYKNTPVLFIADRQSATVLTSYVFDCRYRD